MINADTMRIGGQEVPYWPVSEEWPERVEELPALVRVVHRHMVCEEPFPVSTFHRVAQAVGIGVGLAGRAPYFRISQKWAGPARPFYGVLLGSCNFVGFAILIPKCFLMTINGMFEPITEEEKELFPPRSCAANVAIGAGTVLAGAGAMYPYAVLAGIYNPEPWMPYVIYGSDIGIPLGSTFSMVDAWLSRRHAKCDIEQRLLKGTGIWLSYIQGAKRHFLKHAPEVINFMETLAEMPENLRSYRMIQYAFHQSRAPLEPTACESRSATALGWLVGFGPNVAQIILGGAIGYVGLGEKYNSIAVSIIGALIVMSASGYVQKKGIIDTFVRYLLMLMSCGRSVKYET